MSNIQDEPRIIDPFMRVLFNVTPNDKYVYSYLTDNKQKQQKLLIKAAKNTPTVIDFISTTDGAISEWEGLSRKATKELVLFRNKLAAKLLIHTHEWPSAKLCQLIPVPATLKQNKKNQAILNKITKSLSLDLRQLTVFDVITQIITYVEKQTDDCASLLSEIHALTNKAVSLYSISKGEKPRLNGLKVDELLVDALNGYFKQAPERSKYMLSSRFGLNGQAISNMREIGDTLTPPLSRERVRQIQNREEDTLKTLIPSTANTLRQVLTPMLTKKIPTELPKLSRLFIDTEGLYNFIDCICELPWGTVKNTVNPHYDKRDIQRFFLFNKAPSDMVDFKHYFEDRYEYSDVELNNMIDIMKGDGEIKALNGKIEPATMHGYVAFSQAALCYPNGETLTALLNKSTEYGYQGTKDIRLSSAERNAVLYGSVYLCGKRSYRHCNYLTFTEKEKIIVLDAAHNRLKGVVSNSGIHLKHEFYEINAFGLDYYTVRYIIQQFGAEKGIHFFGASSVDTISLQETLPIKGIKTMIMNAIKKSKKALCAEDVLKSINGISLGHLQMVLSNLTKEKEIIRVSRYLRTDRKQAFKGINNKALMKYIVDAIETKFTQGKPIDITLLKDMANNDNGMFQHQYWYEDFMLYHKDSSHLTLFFKRGFVSLQSFDLPDWRRLVNDTDINGSYAKIAEAVHISKRKAQSIVRSERFILAHS
jgi:hypothetical protein